MLTCGSKGTSRLVVRAAQRGAEQSGRAEQLKSRATGNITCRCCQARAFFLHLPTVGWYDAGRQAGKQASRCLPTFPSTLGPGPLSNGMPACPIECQ